MSMVRRIRSVACTWVETDHESCLACSGEVCHLCLAGFCGIMLDCNCEHDVTERHTEEYWEEERVTLLEDLNAMLKEHDTQTHALREEATAYVTSVLRSITDAGWVAGPSCFCVHMAGRVVFVPSSWERDGVQRRLHTWREVCAWGDSLWKVKA